MPKVDNGKEGVKATLLWMFFLDGL